jgi:hypothetical protein
MDSQTGVRRLSQLIFGGAQYRLEVAAQLVVGKQFSTTDLLVALGDPPGKGSIHTELKRLSEAGLVRPVDRPRGERSMTYLPAPCAFWDACRELASLARLETDQHEQTRALLLSAVGPDASLRAIVGGIPAPPPDFYREGHLASLTTVSSAGSEGGNDD